MDEVFEGLDEVSIESAVGEVFFHAESTYYVVPFLHCDVKYFVYFSPLVGDGSLSFDLDTFQTVIYQDSGHTVASKPYVLKFGLKDNFQSKSMFGFDQTRKIDGLFFTLPTKLANCVNKLLDKTDADELYFLPGSECEKHQKKLDLWYGRISDKVAANHGLLPIHRNAEGGWYGYKKNY